VVELDDGHGDEVTKRDDQVLQLGKEEREKQKKSYGDQDKGINRFLFWHSRHHRGCGFIYDR
jgi:hypothetical protein